MCWYGTHRALALLEPLLSSITVHEFDGASSTMDEIVKRSNPDVVFHLASLFLSQHRPENVEPLIQSNLLFSTQLVEAMVNNGCKLLVNTGTSWQHFEDAHYSPVNLYAATKQAFEVILDYYVEAKGLALISLALFDTYGPGDPRPKLFSLLRKPRNRRSRWQCLPASSCSTWSISTMSSRHSCVRDGRFFNRNPAANAMACPQDIRFA
jgi:nucleoside-diphosphate-sugar epimerase